MSTDPNPYMQVAVRVSLHLSCGCSLPPGKPMPAIEVAWPGKVLICDRHDEYAMVTRVTMHLDATQAEAVGLFAKTVDRDTAEYLAANQFPEKKD